VVAEILQLPQLVELDGVAEVEVRARRVETFLDIQGLAPRELDAELTFDQEFVGAPPENRHLGIDVDGGHGAVGRSPIGL
jgi:hypothetical protein